MRLSMREGGGLGWVAVGVLSLLVGCAAPRMARAPEFSASMEAPSGRFRVEYAPANAPDAALIQRAAEEALPKLERWGALSEPVTLKVMPGHEALEDAVRQQGVDWLRAWSRYGEVFVQAPSTWSPAGSQPQVNELLLHELTHSLMYQLASDQTGWAHKRIPLWFREGMASYTAEQAYRWVSLEEVARHLERFPGSDPVRAPGDLVRDDSNFVYGVAHHAFTFLVRRYGEDAVRGVLREMKTGKDFPEGFESAIGLPPDTFVRDFTHYVRWRGFRNGRALPRANGSRE
jgi:hypothetical protein